jgi:hypothetical protein
MRVAIVVVTCLSTGCAAMLADAPGPDCRETTATSLDAFAAVSSGLTAAIGWGIMASCFQEPCTPAGFVPLGATALTIVSALYLTSAIIGSRANAACRHARTGQRE